MRVPKRQKTEQFITKFAKYYTPAVTIGAAVLAFAAGFRCRKLWNMVTEGMHISGDFVSLCPCYFCTAWIFGGIGAASQIGVLVKGSNYFETIAQMKM